MLSSIQIFVHRVGLLPRLLAAEVVLLALLCAGSLFLVRQLADSFRTSRTNEWFLLGKSTAVAIDGSLSDAIGVLKDTAVWYQDANEEKDYDQAQRILDLTVQRSQVFTGGIVVVGSDHRVVAVDQSHAGLLGHSLAASWPDDSSEQPEKILAWGVRDRSFANDTVAVATPLDPTESTRYVVGLIGADSEVNRILQAAVQLGQSGHADVADDACQTMFSTEPGHFLGPGDHSTYCHALMQQRRSTIGEAATEETEAGSLRGPHVMAFVPLRTLPWALMIGTSTRDVYGPSDQILNGSVGALLVFTALAFVATTVIIRKVVEPVTTLSATARRVAEGKTDERISIAWGGEVGELAHSLETMRGRLAGWAATLEEQVKTRTEELEARNREMNDLYESLQRKEAQRQDLLGRILTAQEDERRRVSRELHDSIGQAFWALTLQLQRLETKADCPPRFRQELEALRQLATDSLGDLRRLTVALRPAALDDLGLVPAIRRYAELYLPEAGVEFDIVDRGLDRRLDPTLETVVYRVVQEAINNVARHSHATRARIDLQADGNTLIAMVEDDGRGFDVQQREHGVGLQGMGERATLVGARIRIESAFGRGTRVVLDVPLS